MTEDQQMATYVFFKGDERYTVTLQFADRSLHIQVDNANRTMGLFEFKEIQHFVIVDNEDNNKRSVLEVIHGDALQLLELKWKPYFSIILKEKAPVESYAS